MNFINIRCCNCGTLHNNYTKENIELFSCERCPCEVGEEE